MKRHALTAGAGAIAIALLVSRRVSLTAARRAIDVDLLLVLFALLVAVELLRVSGFLDFAVAQTVTRFSHHARVRDGADRVQRLARVARDE